MRSFALVALSFAALLGCSEVEVDLGRACVIPAEVTCSDCFNPPFTICSFEPTDALPASYRRTVHCRSRSISAKVRATRGTSSATSSKQLSASL